MQHRDLEHFEKWVKAFILQAILQSRRNRRIIADRSLLRFLIFRIQSALKVTILHQYA